MLASPSRHRPYPHCARLVRCGRKASEKCIRTGTCYQKEIGPPSCRAVGKVTSGARLIGIPDVQTFSGISPVSKSSGKTRVVYFRRACPQFQRQSFHEFARLSVASCQWARNYVDHYTAKGKKYNTVIRALAFKWIR